MIRWTRRDVFVHINSFIKYHQNMYISCTGSFIHPYFGGFSWMNLSVRKCHVWSMQYDDFNLFTRGNRFKAIHPDHSYLGTLGYPCRSTFSDLTLTLNEVNPSKDPVETLSNTCPSTTPVLYCNLCIFWSIVWKLYYCWGTGSCLSKFTKWPPWTPPRGPRGAIGRVLEKQVLGQNGVCFCLLLSLVYLPDKSETKNDFANLSLLGYLPNMTPKEI